MRILLATTSLIALAGCISSDPVDTAGAASFGQAVAANAAAQASQAPVSTAAPQGSGAQGALAQERFSTGHTRPLLPSTTSSANPTSSSR